MKLSRAVIKKMLVAGYGSIVTTASTAVFNSGIAGPAYVASKYAVAGLVKSMATLYGPNEATSWGSDHARVRCEYGDFGHYRHIRQISGSDIVLG